jgi:hypothetical protein
MKQTAVDWLLKELPKGDLEKAQIVIAQAKEIEENNLLEMLHKFAFDYTYNYRGEKTIYEWIPEWFEEYKKLEEKNKKK